MHSGRCPGADTQGRLHDGKQCNAAGNATGNGRGSNAGNAIAATIAYAAMQTLLERLVKMGNCNKFHYGTITAHQLAL